AEPQFDAVAELDLSTIEPSLAGPKRPQDRVPLSRSKVMFESALAGMLAEPMKKRPVRAGGSESGAAAAVAERVDPAIADLDHGAVVVAAITSCTNTSNPSVMIGAGLLARNAVARGLQRKPWVKTSL